MLCFTFRDASCAVIGTFNIYVVQPELLAHMGVIDSVKPRAVAGDLTKPGIRFEIDEAMWTVRPDRLAVESKNQKLDCGLPIEKTLRALSWTPVFAVGINSVWTADEGAELQLPERLRLPQLPDAEQRTVHVAVQRGEQVVNLQLSHFKVKKLLELRINVHSDLNSLRSEPIRLSEEAQRICRSFWELRADSLRVAKELFSAEFDNE